MENEEIQSANSILIIVVVYLNEAEVLKYAKMLSKQSVSKNIQLVIVINKLNQDKREEFIDEVNKIEFKIIVYDPQKNLGYLNGVLYGYRNFISEELIPKWIVISNTDIVIEDQYFFEKFSRNNYHEDIWSIGPSIYSPNKKSYDNPHYLERCTLRKINRLIWIYDQPLLALTYQKLSKIKSSRKRIFKKESQFVYSNHGSFFIISNHLAEKIKNINYEPFLYSEESFIAELINLHNKKSYYDSKLELIHNENSVTGLLGIKKKSQFIADSLRYIRDKFYLNQ